MTTSRRRLLDLVRDERSAALVTVVRGPDGLLGQKLVVQPETAATGSLGDPALDHEAEARARELLAEGQTRTITLPSGAGEIELFIESYPAPETLLIFGGVHVAVHLTKFAKLLGFRVLIVDARGLFATEERFPEADEVVVARAEDYLKTARLGSNTYVAVLTHDPKLDDPALLHFMNTDARFIGAVGSRKTNAARMERLREKGASPEQLARIHAPIGLDLGGKRPEEMALAIIAEIVATKHGKSGGSLRKRATQPEAVPAAG